MATRADEVRAAVSPSRPAPLLLRPLAWLALQLQLLLLGLMSLAWNLVALPLLPLLPRAAGLRLGRAAIAYGYRAFWRVAAASGMLRLDAAVLDALRDERGLVIVSNHPSLLDALMLVARLPRAACIMKASLMRNPLLGPGARLARYIPNDSLYGMVHRAVADLRAGGQLVMFPEATRTTRVPVNRFHASFALIARRAQVPIQVVFIDTESPYLAKGWPLWRLPPLPIRFAVRLGRRFEPPQDIDAARDEIEAYVAAGLRQGPPR
ncbi:lysophospholipid acyltransferase family protein [Rubrivivax sp. A210]|uniref:lysophospholipid acyltransferase family protein n=1 Tax=Rubrivivax sp. A210 TaxID=2772301 RepID=UPI001F4428AB|nr:lysophospholipid acyltransferase family protein [Rubrivivax sp. A210]